MGPRFQTRDLKRIHTDMDADAQIRTDTWVACVGLMQGLKRAHTEEPSLGDGAGEERGKMSQTPRKKTRLQAARHSSPVKILALMEECYLDR